MRKFLQSFLRNQFRPPSRRRHQAGAGVCKADMPAMPENWPRTAIHLVRGYLPAKDKTPSWARIRPAIGIWARGRGRH